MTAQPNALAAALAGQPMTYEQRKAMHAKRQAQRTDNEIAEDEYAERVRQHQQRQRDANFYSPPTAVIGRPDKVSEFVPRLDTYGRPIRS